MTKLNFNAETYHPEELDLLPPGEYEAAITESEIKTTKSGTGEYLELRWTILDGDHKGRHVWQRINIQNPNDKAVAIGQRQLWEICNALGVSHLTDSSQLHDIPVGIPVRIEKGTGEFGDQNVIGRFSTPASGERSDSSSDVPF
jgi:Protein of unknown function (DUF669)